MSQRKILLTKEINSKRKKGFNSRYNHKQRSKALFAEQYNHRIQKVLGFTVNNSCAFACDFNTSLLAYPSGCVIVLYNPKHDKQSHIINPGKKKITCLQFSSDGNFIVTGEAGYQPCVRIFSVPDQYELVSFPRHTGEISCVIFSPDTKYVVSIGYQHDKVINVWDWRKHELFSSNNISARIKSISFAEDGNYFITVGNRHVKFWYLQKSSHHKTTIPLKGRSAILESLQNHVFCDVTCGMARESGKTYAITKSGILCQFNADRTVDNFVRLKNGRARSVICISDMILCGSADGSIHVFNSSLLTLVTTISSPSQVRGHELIAMAIDAKSMWIHCAFSDHSMLIRDIKDFSNPALHSLFRFHDSCAWDIKIVPSISQCDELLKHCFLTSSADGTIVMWKYKKNNCELVEIINLNKSSEKDNSTKYEARSLCIRHDGKHVAAGDRSGNIHVYNLVSREKVTTISAHTGDVLCMDYSNTDDLLVTSGRDRCIHLFDHSYAPMHTIADHSAAVTSVKFTHHGNELQLVTCGADKSLYFFSITNYNEKKEIKREQHFVEKHSMSDMVVVEDAVLVACGSSVNHYDVIGKKLKRSLPVYDLTSTIVRIAVNQQRNLIAASCSDKHLHIMSFSSGEFYCILSGHSEIAVGLTFDLDDRLLSASADSCIFVWTTNDRTKDDQQNIPVAAASLDVGFKASCVDPVLPSPSPALPKWVTQHLPSEDHFSPDLTPKHSIGKWKSKKLEVDEVCEDVSEIPGSPEMSFSATPPEVILSNEKEPMLKYESHDAFMTAKRKSDNIRDGSDIQMENIGQESDRVGLDTITINIVNKERALASWEESVGILRENRDEDIACGDLGRGVVQLKCTEDGRSGDKIMEDPKLETSKALLDVDVNNPGLHVGKASGQCRWYDHHHLENTSSKPAEEHGIGGKLLPEQPHQRALFSDVKQFEKAANNDMLLEDTDEEVDMRRMFYSKKRASEHEPLFSKSKEKSSDRSGNSSNVNNPAICGLKGILSTVGLNINIAPESNKAKNSSSALPEFVQEGAIEECTSSTIYAVSEPWSDITSFASVSTQPSYCSDYDATEKEHVADAHKRNRFTFHAENHAKEKLPYTGIIESRNDSNQDLIITSYKQNNDELLKSRTSANRDVIKDVVDEKEQPTTMEKFFHLRTSTSNSLLLSDHNRNMTRSDKEETSRKSSEIPPALVELLMCVSKKRSLEAKLPDPSVNARVSSSKTSEEDEIATLRPGASNQNFNESRRESKTHISTNKPTGRRSLPTNKTTCLSQSNDNYHCHGYSSKTDDRFDEWRGAQFDCQSASDNLLATFNSAEAMFLKQQVLCSDKPSNRNMSGFYQLIRAFQKIRAKIELMELELNEGSSPQSGALDDSPVFSLLREYSDKLVDMFLVQVDENKKVISAFADAT